MPNPLAAASTLLLLLAAPTAVATQPAGSTDGTGGPDAQVRIRQHIVIQIPRVTVARTAVGAPPAPPAPPIEWVERKAADCVSMSKLAGAAITRADSVDLILKEGKRIRAKLDDECPALDFYSGFYVRPTEDGMICAGRDSFRSRSGAECEVEAFRTLVPAN